MQVIVAVFTAGLAEALGVEVGEGDGVTTASTSWLSFTRTVGAEKPKL